MTTTRPDLLLPQSPALWQTTMMKKNGIPIPTSPLRSCLSRSTYQANQSAGWPPLPSPSPSFLAFFVRPVLPEQWPSCQRHSQLLNRVLTPSSCRERALANNCPPRILPLPQTLMVSNRSPHSPKRKRCGPSMRLTQPNYPLARQTFGSDKEHSIHTPP